MKKKVLIFHNALAPYRVDQFNALSEKYHLRVIFLKGNLQNQKFNTSRLLDQLKCEYKYLLNGFDLKGRYFRFGLFKEIKVFKPEVVISTEYSPTTVILLLLKLILPREIKLGSIVDDSVHICENPRSITRRLIRDFCSKRLDYLILSSESAADWYHVNRGISYKKMIVNPFVQDSRKFYPLKRDLIEYAYSYIDEFVLEGKKVVLYVGRFVKEKGLQHLLNIMKQLCREDENLFFIFVGDGPERDVIKDKISSLMLDNKVLLVGRYEHTKLYAWYLAASTTILPSVNEAFGAVINESLIFGTPVIVSRYAGASTLIISEQQGVITDPTDYSLFLSNSISLLKSLPPVSRLAVTTRRSLMPFDFQNYFSDWDVKLISTTCT